MSNFTWIGILSKNARISLTSCCLFILSEGTFASVMSKEIYSDQVSVADIVIRLNSRFCSVSESKQRSCDYRMMPMYAAFFFLLARDFLFFLCRFLAFLHPFMEMPRIGSYCSVLFFPWQHSYPLFSLGRSPAFPPLLHHGSCMIRRRAEFP